MRLPKEMYCHKSNIYLMSFAMRHVDSLCEALNDPKIAHAVSHIPYPYTLAHAEQWIDSRASIITDTSQRVDFVVIRKEGDKEIVVGSVAFINMNNSPAKRHLAQVSMWVRRGYEGQDIATNALRLLIGFGFDELKLHKIHGFAHPENIGSIKVMKKVGMVHEATIKDDWVRVIDGEECLADSYICSIINPESQYKRLPEDYRSRFND